MQILKKYLFAAILVIPLAVKAQDCPLIKETDPYTKEIKISTGFIPLQGASLAIDATKPEIDFLFSINGANVCLDNNSTANVFFENTKIKVTFRNAGSMNCEGLFHFIFRNTASTNSQLQKLVTQKITSIKFIGNNKQEKTITLTPEQQKSVMDLGTCLINEAKTLIK
jgi:hypothetical protein